ncbi:MAG TPA: ATP-binding cassette domain-containing protein [Spirochaetota bacterium]|nr:ATP-binding cassette domain-containing protein [Spirochaetota bacterium]HOM38953.1 ATP-binding cassette domain-containing protein [Spirochaetota bacterium]HPQ49211.1 ATP-binding cassette domain-containing protein [Spirochaetota bacterium]
MLEIIDLSVSIDNKILLENINIKIPQGENHILFGPNGSGKTSLLMSIIGFPQYKVISGKIIFNGNDITNLSIDERARLGIGIVYQNPPGIKGLMLNNFVNKLEEKYGTKLYSYVDKLKMNELIDRELNINFSGGEKKKSEILQILTQNPDFIMLDEPEAGVDVENINLIGNILKEFLDRKKIKNRKKSSFIITHTGYILDYLSADKGYILINGKIVCEGNPYRIFELIKEKGFKECQLCKL